MKLMDSNSKLSKSSMAAMLIASVLFTVSCEKGNSGMDSKPIPPSASEFRHHRELALDKRMEKVKIDVENGVLNFESINGSLLNINCLSLNQEPVNGEVELTYIELFDKKDMVTTNKPLMGRMENGDKAALVTGGEFFIEVKKDGEPVDPVQGCPIRLQVSSMHTGGPDQDMILWEGIIDENGDLTWDTLDNANGDNKDGLFIEGEFYYAVFSNFGWTNIDRFYSDERPKTTMQVKVPEGYDYKNSAVYISYYGERAMAQLDTYDDITKIFSEHYGQIPIGLDVHIIFATVDGEDWRYAIQDVTIEEDKVYSFSIDDTKTASEEEFTNILSQLP